MFEHFAEVIRTVVFSALPWITRSAGLAEALDTLNGDQIARFPAARGYEGAPCDAGDYMNMAPQDGEACIAFVDAESMPAAIETHSRYSVLEGQFRAVLWYDERKIVEADPALQMIADVMRGVEAANYATPGIHGVRVKSANLETNADRIWARYGLKADDSGLFMYPYRSIAITFRARFNFTPACFVGPLTPDLAAC